MFARTYILFYNMNSDKKKNMQQTIFNEDNLREDEIDEVVTRVKVYLINSNNEILIANSAGGYQLPGGHVEEGETLEQAVIREIKEETGIKLEKRELGEPFYEVKHYTKNHKSKNINRESNIIYYIVNSDKKPNLKGLNLTENEKKNNFKIDYLKFDEFDSKLNYVKQNNPNEINRVIASEILISFEYLKKYLKQACKLC